MKIKYRVRPNCELLDGFYVDPQKEFWPFVREVQAWRPGGLTMITQDQFNQSKWFIENDGSVYAEMGFGMVRVRAFLFLFKVVRTKADVMLKDTNSILQFVKT